MTYRLWHKQNTKENFVVNPIKKHPLARTNDLVVKKIEDETLIYDLLNNKAVCLNKTAFWVWENCNGENDPVDLVRILSTKFESQVSEELVLLALKRLFEENLVKNLSEEKDGYPRLARREVIRNIGFSSAIALPIVASIVSPRAIQAQIVS